MGYGRWTRSEFISYSTKNGRIVTADGTLDSRYTDGQLFRQYGLHPRLDPRNVMRECCDSAEHPESIPVILALDVTGSMGPASAQVARKMNEVMTRLYDSVRDVEFMIMGIGDLAYDRAPIQISQFESDIRIAEQLDLVYMEHGGGSNLFESYTAAWYMGLHHTRLDCRKRGARGLIITMGDEPLNPYLPAQPLAAATGDAVQTDIETDGLYNETIRKYDIWHLHVNHRAGDPWWPRVQESFGTQLPQGHLVNVTVEEISDAIVRIVTAHSEKQRGETAICRDAGRDDEKTGSKTGMAGIGNVITW
ncbi:MAG: vWA domain-containing protein [Clostridia bacterium]|nr:vWA domain-containing protein [Clostridia bacterium]